jgi:hypothetical protein
VSEEHDPERDESVEGEDGPEAVNSADPASVERQKKRSRTWTAQRREFWRQTLSTEIGRRAVWEFLTLECYFGNVPVAASPSGHPDPMATMYWNGVKRVGDRLYDLLQRSDHAAVYQMRLEHDGEFSEARPRRSR